MLHSGYIPDCFASFQVVARCATHGIIQLTALAVGEAMVTPDAAHLAMASPHRQYCASRRATQTRTHIVLSAEHRCSITSPRMADGFSSMNLARRGKSIPALHRSTSDHSTSPYFLAINRQHAPMRGKRPAGSHSSSTASANWIAPFSRSTAALILPHSVSMPFS